MPGFIKSHSSQSGQVLLIVVLVMIIALTVGLSLVARSVTSLRTSTQETSSQEALSAAEAGVEQALRNGIYNGIGASSSGSLNNASYTSQVIQVKGTQLNLNGGNPVLKDDGVDFWLSKYSSDLTQLYTSPYSGNISILWGDPNVIDKCKQAALEIILVSGTKIAPTTTRYAYDPCDSTGSAPRTPTNHFTSPNSTSCGADSSTCVTKRIDFSQTNSSTTYSYKTDSIAVTSGLFMRIIPLYYSTILGVKAFTGFAAFPAQGTLVAATGSANLDGTKRSIQVFQGYPRIPAEFFPYTIFSP